MDTRILSTTDRRLFDKASKWLKNSGHIIVEVYVPHSGAGSDLFIVESVEQLKTLVFNAKPKTFLTLMCEPSFIMQGIVDDNFIQEACAIFATKNTYTVIIPAFYPNQYEELGWGTRAIGLDLILEQLCGKLVWIGEEPVIISPDDVSQRNSQYYVFAQKPKHL